MIRLILVAALSVMLTACGPVQSAQVQDQINAMTGLSKEKVLSCMGPPSSKSSEGATEVWTYNNAGSVTTNAYVSGNQYGTFGSANTTQEYCVVNLTMNDGIVVNANYRSQGKLLAPSLPCYNVLSVCTAGRIGSSLTDKTKEAHKYCQELYADARLDPIRDVIAIDKIPTLTQQQNPDFITNEQRPALDAYKELHEQCRNKIAVANPHLWKLMTHVQPNPYKDLTLLYNKKITIGQFNTRKQEVQDKLKAVIADQTK
jgi:hypothetical protein